MGSDLEKQRARFLAKLVKRFCACGCGRFFKVLPESRQVLFSNEECTTQVKKTISRIQYGKGLKYE